MGIILLVLVVVLVIWCITAYNGIVHLKTSCEEAFSTMDIYLKKRSDLIPNLVNTVKGYAEFEKETLEKVIQARAHALNASESERIQAENELSGALGRLIAVSEAYPDLKANQSFVSLQKELQDMEDEIANSRFQR